MDQTLPNQPDSQIPENVREFIVSLINESGGQDLDETTKQQAIEQIYVRLDNYLASVLIEALPPEKLDEFTKMNEENRSQAEVETFLKENVPDIQKISDQAFIDFRAMFLQGFDAETNTSQTPPADHATN